MNDNKLPNYYDVLIEAQKCRPRPCYTAKHLYTLFVESVEAPDAETAVMLVLRKHWGEDCILFSSEGEPGWVVAGPDDFDCDPWLEIPVEEINDCATAVPYERRLLLAGVRPLGFVQ